MNEVVVFSVPSVKEVHAMIGRILIILILTFLAASSFAGPPFRTDDPEPVEYGHWKVYVASQGSFDRDETSITTPHFEINYGILPDVQVHLITPFEYVKPKGQPSHHGYSDTEFGVKYRFPQETDSRPQVGTFPIFLLPTGDKERELGSGHVQFFLPLWLQKGWGPWKTYGGGGYWINPGTGNKDYWFLGWEAEHEMSKNLSLGAEIFYQTASEAGGDSDLGFNLGAIINFSDLHHLLLSAGRDLSGPNNASFYAGYQLTF